jgi:hypothetical protein
MKTIAFLSMLFALSVVSTRAQEAKGGQVLVESQSVKKETPEKKAPVIPPKPTNQILGQPVTFGGYFTDFVRAENKRALFDLRTPLDFQKDSENVSFYPNTEKVRGVVLFSIKF